MALRCLTGHIGYGGVIYAAGDVFDVDDDDVVKSLIVEGDAELVEAIVPDVEPENVVKTEPTKTTRGRKKVVNER